MDALFFYLMDTPMAVIFAVVFTPFLSIALAIFIMTMKARGRDIRKEDGLAVRIGKEAFDLALPMGNPQADMMTVFSFGKKQPERVDSVTVFRATSGWRYGFIVVTAFLVYLCTQMEQGPLIHYLVIGGGLLWCGIYMWRFRLEIDGKDMVCTTHTLQIKHFDLNLLKSIRYTQDGYKLRFTDGRRLTVPQFLEGHDHFKRKMIETLEINGY